ncbi:MAG: hypothetical protein IIZ13_11325 [Renibacterium sp.]|nr:hypothetical protein [Renibacterium sp.]
MPATAAPLAPAAVRMLAAFAGLGAAVTSYGLASNLLATATVQQNAPAWLAWPAAALAAGWASAVLYWSIVSFRAQRPLRPGLALRAMAAAVALEVLVLFTELGQRRLDGTLAATILLELVLLGSVGWLQRRHPAASGPASAPGAAAAPPAGRLLLSMFAAAILVATVSTAGLAAGVAGGYAVDHSTGHHH